MVNPEGEPGDNDDHHGGQVDGDDVERELSRKQKVNLTKIVLRSEVKIPNMLKVIARNVFFYIYFL